MCDPAFRQGKCWSRMRAIAESGRIKNGKQEWAERIGEAGYAVWFPGVGCALGGRRDCERPVRLVSSIKHQVEFRLGLRDHRPEGMADMWSREEMECDRRARGYQWQRERLAELSLQATLRMWCGRPAKTVALFCCCLIRTSAADRPTQTATL